MPRYAAGYFRSGFTLVELLVVITIIAGMIALLLPSIGQAREVSKNMKCKGQEHQVSLAIMNYSTDSNGYAPLINSTSTPQSTWGNFAVRAKWFTPQSTFIHEEVLPVARRHGVPVQVISRCLHTGLGSRPREFADLIAGGAAAAGFDAYNWYEQENMVDTNQGGYPMLKGPVEPYFAQVRQTLREIAEA